ncbi:hypothetical protein DKG77_12005 [Flagellimonas aquimarina]|uniref:Uncharacterized protein n=1 Tax=Flagellimonas aquimarina TaxID=2201895 RepID=A0A316L1S6_9FLAO|nr:hypothetical protein [Allomuricauda koreensis]PWL38945.1 hypothetical protein DKG77_12005 [Allomuricauda koreensis]
MKKCFNCGKNGADLYGYIICDTCKTKLRLFTPETIEKYNSKDSEGFRKEIQRRLDYLDKEYVKKRIKLLHIQDQLKSF